MITEIKPKLAINVRNISAEGPVWDAGNERIIWIDLRLGSVHEGKSDGAGGWRQSRQWDLGRPVGAAIPRAKGGLLVAAGTEILALSDEGEVSTFARINADPDRVKFNDAKCDPQGRLWAGTMDLDLLVPGREITRGRCALYRVNPDGGVRTVLEGVTLSNGLDWSPDGSIFYYIDTITGCVDAFDFDAAQGAISNRRTIVTFKGEEGLPDGMTVDREGCLWVAVVRTGTVRRFAPDGSLLGRIEVDTTGVTSCAFGGTDGGDLFITTSRVKQKGHGLDLTRGFQAEVPDYDPSKPGAGALQVCRPGVAGMPGRAFAG